MNIQHTISQLLKIGLTQASIAQSINRKQSTVSDMKSGKYGGARPSADVVEGLNRLIRKHKDELNQLKNKQVS